MPKKVVKKPADGRTGWQNIGDLLDPHKRKVRDLKIGQTLTFSQEGSLHHYKIMKIPGNGNVWVRRVTLMSDENFKSHYGHNVDTTQTPMWCTDCEMPVDGK